MQLKSAEFESAVEKRDFQAWLVFGPDQGRVSLLATSLQRRYAGADSVAAVREAADAVRDPAMLADHLHGATLFSPAPVLRLRNGDDKLAKVLEPFLASGIGEGRLIVDAGELTGASKIKKLFEVAKHLAALPCWTPTETELAERAARKLKALDVTYERGVPERIASLSPPDSGALLTECEKLAVYANGAGLSLADVDAASSDHAEAGFSDLSLAAAAGRTEQALVAYYRLVNTGESAIGVLRALQRHFQRLHTARLMVDDGSDADTAISRLRPPVFWKEKAKFKAQLRKHGLRAFEAAITRLVEVERQIKAGADEIPVVGQTLLDLTLKLHASAS